MYIYLRQFNQFPDDKCPPPEVKGIRLVHGDTLYDGVLEIYKDGRWYTLCATYFGWSEYARGKKLDRMVLKDTVFTMIQ